MHTNRPHLKQAIMHTNRPHLSQTDDDLDRAESIYPVVVRYVGAGSV